jgi:hypothetical protein
MKKEVIVAIIFGFIIGLTIAFGAYNANKSLQQAKNKPAPSSSTASNQQNTAPTNKLVIKEPEENIVIRTNEATVSGQAEPYVTIAVMAENGEELLSTDGQGLFSTQVDLISGTNEIKVVVIDKNDQTEELIIPVVYSTQKIE